MKKSILVRTLAALLLAATLASCSSDGITVEKSTDKAPTNTVATTVSNQTNDPVTTPNGAKSIEECATDVISLLTEMTASDEYQKMYGLQESQIALINKLKSGNYTKPSAVYELTVTDETINYYMAEYGMDKISDSLKDSFVKTMNSSLANFVNKAVGVDATVVGALLNAGKSFICPEAEKAFTLLYVYENGNPILITFTPGEGGAVGVGCGYLFSDSFPVESEQKIEEFFISADVGVTAKKK